MNTDCHSTDTFTNEALAFTERHGEQLGPVAATFGGLTFGAMKAIAECPNCPGHFRVPYDAEGRLAWPVGNGNWKYLRCPECKGVWKLGE